MLTTLADTRTNPLTLALIFFLVTLGLTVGPVLAIRLLIARLFFETPRDDRERNLFDSFTPGLIALGFGIVVMLTFWTVMKNEAHNFVNHVQQASSQAVQVTEFVERNRQQRTAAFETIGYPIAPAIVQPPKFEAADTSKTKAKSAAAVHETPAVVQYVGTKPVGVPRETLPDWTEDVDELSNICVIESGLHATIELAEDDALDQLRSLLTEQFVKQHPEARGWLPSDELVMESGSILQRAVERSEITVGDFTNPMYEVYWQVDASAHDGLYTAWRPTIVHSRLAWLGGGLALLTLLFGSTAAVLRVDEQTGGTKRKQLAAGTVLGWAALGGALLMLA